MNDLNSCETRKLEGDVDVIAVRAPFCVGISQLNPILQELVLMSSMPLIGQSWNRSSRSTSSTSGRSSQKYLYLLRFKG